MGIRSCLHQHGTTIESVPWCKSYSPVLLQPFICQPSCKPYPPVLLQPFVCHGMDKHQLHLRAQPPRQCKGVCMHLLHPAPLHHEQQQRVCGQGFAASHVTSSSVAYAVQQQHLVVVEQVGGHLVGACSITLDGAGISELCDKKEGEGPKRGSESFIPPHAEAEVCCYQCKQLLIHWLLLDYCCRPCGEQQHNELLNFAVLHGYLTGLVIKRGICCGHDPCCC